MNIDTEKLKNLINENKKIWEIVEILNCKTSDIRREMHHLNISTPPKFWTKGVKIGRPIGIPMTEHQKISNSQLFKGCNNPFYNHKHTDETRKKMRDHHADFSKEKNPFKRSIEKNEIKRKEHKERCKKIWDNRDFEYRKVVGEKLSKSMSKSKKFEDPRFHKFYNCGFVETRKGGLLFCRSSWEKEVCKILDYCELVISFQLEPFSIKYIDNDKIRHTRIDFLINLISGKKLMVEVKPKPLQLLNSIKIEAYKNYCLKNDIIFRTYDHIEDNLIKIMESVNDT